MAEITLKGEKFHTNGALPEIDSVAPDFCLVDKSLGDTSLNDIKGKKTVISIVPSLDTPVCLSSAREFNERVIKVPDTVLLIVSADLPFAQKRACDAEGLENVHTLSMMRSKAFARDYGVYIIDGPLEGLAARAVLILDENNKVVYSELVSEVSAEPDYESAIAALNE